MFPDYPISAQYGPPIKSQALGRIIQYEQTMHRRMGLVRPQRYVRLWNYYAGTNLPPENVEQPLGINYFKAICDKHVSFFWGETDENLLAFSVRPRDKRHTEDPTSTHIRQYIESVYDANHANTVLWQASLNGSIYGDSVLRIRWSATEERVVIDNIAPEYFHCRWDVADPWQLTEVIIAYPIARDEAYQRYGVYGNDQYTYNQINPDYLPGLGIYWEHWTPTTYRVWIDDTPVIDEPNPYQWLDAQSQMHEGIIPFVHIANQRSGDDFWGFGDAEHMMLLQDEYNRRMGDQGDIIDNHAHPIVTLQHFHGDVEDLPVGPDAVWDLGSDGAAGLLEARGSTMTPEYMTTLREVMLDTSAMPEITFGRQTRGNGRAQSSATAIQLIMLPVVERARRKRVQWMYGIERLIRYIIHVQQIRDPQALGFPYGQLNNYMIRPVFGPILPRDRLATVNENVTLVVNGLRSMERALEDLGEDDIQHQIQVVEKEMVIRAVADAGGKNNDQGTGGSNQLPDGVRSGAGKPMKPGQPVPDAGQGATAPALQNFDAS